MWQDESLKPFIQGAHKTKQTTIAQFLYPLNWVGNDGPCDVYSLKAFDKSQL